MPPLQSGPPTEVGIVIDEKAGVRRHDWLIPEILRDKRREPLPLRGKHRGHSFGDPLHVFSVPEAEHSKHQACDVLGMGLCVCQTQSRTPRQPENDPPLDIEHFPQRLDVGDEMLGGVCL